MLLNLPEVRLHLNLGSDEESDTLLSNLILASESYTQEYCARKFYEPDATIPETDTTGITLPDCVKQAMLLLIGHFFENRESTTPLNIKVLPFGFEQLAGIKRIRHLDI